MKVIILIVFLVIIASLAQALYFLMTDRSRTPRTVRALTIRIGLSLALFGLLLFASLVGWIKPHGLRYVQQPSVSSPAVKTPERNQ